MAVALFVVGYRFLGHEWIDSLYMVILTVSTVGFTEKSQLAAGEQLFSIAVMILGIGLVAYTFGGFLEFITAGELERTVEERKRQLEVEQLENHTIICGYGRIGRQLAAELQHRREPLVIVEQSEDRSRHAEQSFLVIRGDATEEEILNTARISKAKALVTALPADSDNVFITLTARDLNPNLCIIARCRTAVD